MTREEAIKAVVQALEDCGGADWRRDAREVLSALGASDEEIDRAMPDED